VSDSLDGKLALITGAGRGVGEGIAQCLAARGARVAVNDLHSERAAAVAEQIGSTGVAAYAIPFDVADPEAILAGVAAAEAELGPIDILVSNAGIPESRRTVMFSQSSPELDWRPYVDLNVYGPMHLIRAVLPGMCDRRWGRVIQISSGSGARGLPAGQAVYGASKAFTDGLLRHLALEVARAGVTINAIAAGMMSSMRFHLPDAEVQTLAQSIPLGRLGEGHDIGTAVAWLASPESSWVTGQVIHVNGGAYQGR
jgi:NAD(P)-dependent dehydrogenase (short-subunit alcohol dehydrogenase family)